MKERLIQDIQNLLNNYEGTSLTSINPELLAYMSEEDLKKIIDELLYRKENVVAENTAWLQQFKTEKM